jgi:uncharacterized oxidoreductase
MPVIRSTTLIDFVSRIFRAVGATEKGATQVAKSLVAGNLSGHDSHGIVRVRQYLDTIAKGNLDPAAEPVIAHQAGAITMVDARLSFGQIGADFAMQVTINQAREHSLAATGLFNCNHVGRLGDWVQMAADQDLIGLAFCNGGRAGGRVTPYGGAAHLLGTNPIAAAIPVAGRPPLIIDFATSIVAEGKVRVARNRGQSVPTGWLQDVEGHPSTDPNDLYAGGMLLPAAEHKGYGLALLMEFMGGILTGQGWPGLPGYTSLRNGVLFLVLSAEAFRPTADFLADGAALCAQVKSTPPAANFDEVLLPGEPEERNAEQRRREGIPIDETTWNQLVEAAAALDVMSPS